MQPVSTGPRQTLGVDGDDPREISLSAAAPQAYSYLQQIPSVSLRANILPPSRRAARHLNLVTLTRGTGPAFEREGNQCQPASSLATALLLRFPQLPDVKSNMGINSSTLAKQQTFSLPSQRKTTRAGDRTERYTLTKCPPSVTGEIVLGRRRAHNSRVSPISQRSNHPPWELVQKAKRPAPGSSSATSEAPP